MAHANPDILLVIPAYREHLRLPAFLGHLIKQMEALPYRVDILIVDDGSPTSEVQKLRESINVGTFGSCRVLRPLGLVENQGKGGAILEGWRSGVTARWFAFVDGDGAVPASEVKRLFNLITIENQNGACLFATRIQMLGRKIGRRLFRHISGRIFATLVNILFRAGVYDTQCGLKIVSAKSFHQIDPFLEGAGLCFDVELMLALKHGGCRIDEIPIDWEDQAGGKVLVWKHCWGMLIRLIKLRFRKRYGDKR